MSAGEVAGQCPDCRGIGRVLDGNLQTDAKCPTCLGLGQTPQPPLVHGELVDILADIMAGKAKEPGDVKRLAQAHAAIKELVGRERTAAKHEQRHQPLGVSRWIAVGEEHGYWEHEMTTRKIADQRRRLEGL